MGEVFIRQRVEDLGKAIRAKDIDGVMSLYAPNIVSFDVDPPLRYAGSDRKRRTWQGMFAASSSPDETLKAIEKAGGTVMTPKHPIGEWGFMADFADPEGNVLSLWEKPKR